MGKEKHQMHKFPVGHERTSGYLETQPHRAESIHVKEFENRFITSYSHKRDKQDNDADKQSSFPPAFYPTDFIDKPNLTRKILFGWGIAGVLSVSAGLALLYFGIPGGRTMIGIGIGQTVAFTPFILRWFWRKKR